MTCLRKALDKKHGCVIKNPSLCNVAGGRTCGLVDLLLLDVVVQAEKDNETPKKSFSPIVKALLTSLIQNCTAAKR